MEKFIDAFVALIDALFAALEKFLGNKNQYVDILPSITIK